ncbi:MAG TPA: SoxR reducing system RseC family protein [Clostridiales bacterium]|nr:SoxR reducing system RseC family protein [Clostridiales bacterium]
MNEFGEIVDIQEDNAVVMVRRSSACSKCGACQMGSHSDEMILTIPNVLKGEVGDFVELELASGQVLKASAITYLIPLAALILGVAAGFLLGGLYGFNQELGGALLGLLFTALSFLVIRALEPYFQKGHQFSPKMVQIIKTKKGENDNGK